MAFGSGLLEQISKWRYLRVGSNPTLLTFFSFEATGGCSTSGAQCRKVSRWATFEVSVNNFEEILLSTRIIRDWMCVCLSQPNIKMPMI